MATDKHKITQVRDALTYDPDNINEVIQLDEIPEALADKVLCGASTTACVILDIVFEGNEQQMRRFLNCFIIRSEQLKAANMFMEDVL